MDLKTKLETRIARLTKEITSKEGALKRAQVDLQNLSYTESRITKQREKKIKKASAPGMVKEVKSDSKTISADDKIEIPTLEMDLPAPGDVAPKKEKKPFLLF